MTTSNKLDLRRGLAVVLLACVLMTVAGYLLKSQCIGDYGVVRDRKLCSNDIQFLYASRGLVSKQFPYIHGSLHNGQLTGGTLEYPVLTGVFAWFASLFVNDDGRYLQVTALLLAPFSLLTAWLLFGMARWRALLYALAPPLIWYSFHNWDLLVVAATVGAFYSWSRGRPLWAAGLLAVGGALKLWPAFFVLPLILDRLRAGRRSEAVGVGVAAAATFAVINAPFALVNESGWWAPYAFQKLRAADVTTNSIWFWGFPQLTTDQLNVLCPILLAVTFLAAAAAGWFRSRGGREPFPFLQVCAAILCAFLLLNKVHSPQYALWLLPFFCLVRLRLGWWAAYMALDATLYVGLFRWFYDLSRGIDFGIAKQAVVIGVWGRAAMLVLMYVAFLKASSAVTSRPAVVAEPERAMAPL
jgi:uncharacterized membrane protein